MGRVMKKIRKEEDREMKRGQVYSQNEQLSQSPHLDLPETLWLKVPRVRGWWEVLPGADAALASRCLMSRVDRSLGKWALWWREDQGQSQAAKLGTRETWLPGLLGAQTPPQHRAPPLPTAYNTEPSRTEHSLGQTYLPVGNDVWCREHCAGSDPEANKSHSNNNNNKN